MLKRKPKRAPMATYTKDKPKQERKRPIQATRNGEFSLIEWFWVVVLTIGLVFVLSVFGAI